MPINYAEEAQRVREHSKREWFKPKVGRIKIKILEEPEIIEKIFDEGKETEKKVDQLRVNIEVDGKKKTWDMGRGESQASSYGQLMLIANDRGKLKDQELELTVTSDGTKNIFLFDEALPLMKPKEEKVT